LRELHIAPGSSAGGCLKQALNPKPGTLLASQDSLSCGPLLAFDSLQQWHDMRVQYWRSIDEGSAELLEPELDVIPNTDALRAAESIVLWIGTGTDEQLLLVWTVQALRVLQIPLTRLRVVQFGREPTKGFEVVGLGVLDPAQVRAHPPPATLTEENIAEIDRAWAAVTAPVPGALLAFIADDQRSVLPYLRRALKAIVFRFPDLTTGLNCWEDLLLRYVGEKGRSVARVIGYTITHDMERPNWVGDVYLFARLRHLADPRLPHPFLTLGGSKISMRGSEVAVTDVGIKALRGGANFVALNGVEEWIGGVHLQSTEGKVWFRSGEMLVESNAENAAN
jgi:hypothetical protein